MTIHYGHAGILGTCSYEAKTIRLEKYPVVYSQSGPVGMHIPGTGFTVSHTCNLQDGEQDMSIVTSAWEPQVSTKSASTLESYDTSQCNDAEKALARVYTTVYSRHCGCLFPQRSEAQSLLANVLGQRIMHADERLAQG